jgi:ABC-type transporter Mla MlaB component
MAFMGDTPMSLTITTIDKYNYTISGPFKIENVSGAWMEMQHILSGDLSPILDMSKVTDMDSAGLAILVRLIHKAHKRGLTIRFKNIPEKMQAIVNLHHLRINLSGNERSDFSDVTG